MAFAAPPLADNDDEILSSEAVSSAATVASSTAATTARRSDVDELHAERLLAGTTISKRRCDALAKRVIELATASSNCCCTSRNAAIDVEADVVAAATSSSLVLRDVRAYVAIACCSDRNPDT